jgi:hypothetical protein
MMAAMEFLADTDQPYAEAKTNLLRAEIMAKRARARIFVIGAGSVEQRKADAESHSEVIAADEGLCSATLEFEALKARRSRAEIVIDVWRSVEASRRKN